jgi:NodT family efflux transporter outer membrane factor (OMF) lipoprotein
VRAPLRRALPLLSLALVGAALPAPAGAQVEPGRAAVASPSTPALDDRSRAALSFWKTLDDPALERLLAEALRASPDLRAVAAGVRGARAERFRTALDLAPTVTATGAYTRQRISGATFPGIDGRLPEQGLWEAGLRLEWEVDAFGRTRRSLEGRSALVEAAERDVDDAHVVLVAEVAATYFVLRGERDRLEVARGNAENQRHTLAVTLDRLEAGRGTALDSERARAQLSSTLAAVPDLEASIDALRHRLAMLLGRSPASIDPELAGSGEPLTLPEALPHADLGALVRGRPDVRGAERRLAARGALVGSARAGYLPRISIQGALGYTASELDAFGESGTPRYAVGPVISWPLLDIGRVRAEVDAARADQAQARARFESGVLRAEQEIETAVTRFRGARERLAHLEAAAAASERATELARLRFEEGAADFLEVLDSERRQLETQDRLAAGRTAAVGALVSVYRASGGRWPTGAAGGR